MKVLLRYAFEELNLHRLNLTVFEYNPRAIRSYEGRFPPRRPRAPGAAPRQQTLGYAVHGEM